MTEISHKSGRWDRKSIFYGVLCLLLPLPIPIAHQVFGVFTYTQGAYGELGVLAVLLCSLMASVNSGWGRLLAAQAFVILGFVPRLVFPIFTGVLDMTLAQFLILAATSSVFAAVFLAVHRHLARGESPYIRIFVYTMCLAAFGMHALLLPVLLGEPMRSYIIHVANPGEEIVETNPSGTLLLTHSALMPVQATLYAHAMGHVTVLRQESLRGYPVGIRVRDEDTLIALRMESEDKVVERIDFVRFSASGLEPLGSYPCTSEENPSHLVNNLSPEGVLLALADGGFVDVATGTRRDMLPANSDPDGRLVFIQWSEPEGRAVYYHESDRRLLILDTDTGSLGTYTLRGRPESAHALSLLPGAQKVWYEEVPLFIEQNAFLEDLVEQKRVKISRKQGKARPGNALLWVGEKRLSYITATGALDGLDFDFDPKKFGWERHSQLLDMTAHAALARDANWLFWVTQAPYGEGTAIHGKQLR